MGSRHHWISGVQIGMLMAFVKEERDAQATKLLKEIEANQYLCDKEEFEKLAKKLKN